MLVEKTVFTNYFELLRAVFVVMENRDSKARLMPIKNLLILTADTSYDANDQTVVFSLTVWSAKESHRVDEAIIGAFIIPQQYNRFYLLDFATVETLRKSGIVPSKTLYLCRISDMHIHYEGEQIDAYSLYTDDIVIMDEIISRPSYITLDDHHKMIIRDVDMNEIIESQEN